MERWQLVTVIIACYLGLTLAVGLIGGRRASKSVTGYVAGDRSFGLLVMYFIMGATVFSAFAFLGGPGWIYSRGAAAFYILSYGVLGFAPWYFMGPKAAELGRRRGYVTQAQLLTGRFPSRTLSVMLAVMSVAAFIPYVTLQMRGAGIVIEAVTDGHIPVWAGAGLAYGIVLIYVLGGGVSAVGWTNTFQGIFMLIIAWTLGIWLPMKLYGGVGPMFEELAARRPEMLTAPGLNAEGDPWTWGGYSSAILVSAIGISMWPHIFMKAFTARSDEILRKTVILFPTFQIFLIPVFLIGFAGILFAVKPPEADFILPHMILEVGLPPLIVGLFCAGALSASMSTGDALLHAAASIAVEDGVQQFARVDDRRQRLLMRGFVLGIGIVSYFFAATGEESLVVLLLTAYGIIAQFFPSLFAAMYWRRATTPGILSGLVAGSAAALWIFFNPEMSPLGLHEGIVGLLVHVPVLVAVSLATAPQEEEHTRAFVDLEKLPGDAREDVAPAPLA